MRIINNILDLTGSTVLPIGGAEHDQNDQNDDFCSI
jgi:hypothetical protein